MIDRLIAIALRNRLGVTMTAVLLIVAGSVALARLPIDAMPDVTSVQVQILTKAPALGPLEVEQFITRPVENALSGLPRLEQVRSMSRYGLSAVTVVFTDDTDIYWARNLVEQRLSSAQEAIPPGVERPEMGPITTGLGEVFMFVVEGGGRSPMELRTLLDWDIASRLRAVPGVIEVNTWGGLAKQYHVLVDPGRLLAYRLTLPQVFEALERNNLNRGGGIIEKGGEAYVIRGEGMVAGAGDLEKVVVGTTGEGTPILVRHVARVEEGGMLRIGGATKDGEGETVIGMVLMLQGENARDVVTRVKKTLADIAPSLPAGVRIVPYYDRETLVGSVIRTVSRNLVEGGLLVVAVLLLILGNLRGGLIVASAIPLSMLFAFIGMVRAGISGNLMSLGAIDFGLIVDGSVVMVENIIRRLAGRPLSPPERDREILAAAIEVGRPIAFAVGIILIVYLPILTLSGIEGKLFRPMAWTVVFAVAGSLVLALTLVPVLCSLFLGRTVREQETRLLHLAQRAYEPLLRSSMARPRATALAAGTVFAVSLGAAALLGSEFVPRLDEGDIVVQASRLPSVSLSQSLASTTEIERVLRRLPEVRTVVSRTGSPEVATDVMGLDLSDVFVMLKPRREWRRGLTKEALVAEMHEALEAGVPGNVFAFTQPIEMRFNELIAGSKSDLAVKIFGDDLDVLAQKGGELAAILAGVPGASDVRVEQTAGLPMIRVRVDRDRIARLGASVDDVLAVVEAARSGRVVGSVLEGRRRFDVVVRLEEGIAADPHALAAVPVGASDRRLVPLAQTAEIALGEGPAQISREQALRRISVEANVRGRDLGRFVAEARRAVAARLDLPSGYYVTWGGQFEHLQAAARRLALAVPLALFLIFVLLHAAFGSLRPALLIFLNVPMAATGGVVALVSRQMPFSISAGIGFIALFGVAVLNGVVLVSFIRKLQDEEGLGPAEAAWRGARIRLRPVLMTALVASLGFLPMALATGPGAEVQKPLATVVIGGLLTSTLLTLLVLPALYRWFAPPPRS
ncbi:MAG TPA: CusA/CzcA family heavy metal efflux RND transporter [Candidatus Polarisedimenticolia bacterium]|jgi:cobalt-zinc-cadmium resistance protein CzcA|nr:CusA/CzcA family heavy metal efflux RND transporter [Candidatus Polarisedimenticolia bacterium]